MFMTHHASWLLQATVCYRSKNKPFELVHSAKHDLRVVTQHFLSYYLLVTFFSCLVGRKKKKIQCKLLFKKYNKLKRRKKTWERYTIAGYEKFIMTSRMLLCVSHLQQCYQCYWNEIESIFYDGNFAAKP